jgi:glutamate-5-semialdehyde dehydrogenase
MKSLDAVFDSLKIAQSSLALANRNAKDKALRAVISAIHEDRKNILAANETDIEKARAAGMKEALIDRLALNEKRIDDILDGIDTVIRQEDPINKVKSGWAHPNGMFIEQVTVPLGVACIIYESRPNVTVDAFCLAYKAGCAILLRGSSAALKSNAALVAAIKKGLQNGGGFPDSVELADSGNRDDVDIILNARGKIDVVLPRGGHDLIQRVVQNARIPVIETGEGNCHIYVEPSADMDNAAEMIVAAKIQKPGVCNSVETLLVHKDAAGILMPKLAKQIAGKAELRCDDVSKKAIVVVPENLILKDANESDWAEEFLDYILAVKTVSNVDEAIDHINRYSTKHSEAILSFDLKSIEAFEKKVDAACVYRNASIRFTDGGEFGFGAELGISTQKFHARGPMGLEALTTIKYRIRGQGQIR